jgi:hypothetical protein
VRLAEIALREQRMLVVAEDRGEVGVNLLKYSGLCHYFSIGIHPDEHDLRFLDPEGVIVGLTAKGRAKQDKTGFVVHARA